MKKEHLFDAVPRKASLAEGEIGHGFKTDLSMIQTREKWFPYIVKDDVELLCLPFLPSLRIARDGTQFFMYVRRALYQLSYSPSPRCDFLHKLF